MWDDLGVNNFMPKRKGYQMYNTPSSQPGGKVPLPPRFTPGDVLYWPDGDSLIFVEGVDVFRLIYHTRSLSSGQLDRCPVLPVDAYYDKWEDCIVPMPRTITLPNAVNTSSSGYYPWPGNIPQGGSYTPSLIPTAKVGDVIFWSPGVSSMIYKITGETPYCFDCVVLDSILYLSPGKEFSSPKDYALIDSEVIGSDDWMNISFGGPKKCNCPIFDVVNFGCKCGGV